MALFLLVADGVVVDETPAPFDVNEQLTWTGDVSAVQPLPQRGWSATESNGAWSFAAPTAPALSASEQAQQAYDAAIAGGIVITSTSAPALNGVYAVDPVSAVDISDEAQFIAQFKEFTNGLSTNLLWALLDGQPVTFPTTDAFMAFAKAAAQGVAGAKLARLQGVAIPPLAATIA